jgi:hypothetical protein
VLTEEKLDEIGARLEYSPENPLNALHRRQGFIFLGHKFQLSSVSEKEIRRVNVKDLMEVRGMHA